MGKIAIWFGLLAAIPSIMAYIRLSKLIRDSSSTVQPNIASWIPWLCVDASILYASLSAGVTTTMFVFAVFTIGSATIIALVFKKGKLELSLLDKIALFVSAIAFIAWKMTDTPSVAVYLNTAVAVAGTIPTIRQAWQTPEKEDLMVWTYFLIGGTLNVVAVETWDMINGLPAVAVSLLQVMIVGSLQRPRRS